MIDIMTAVSGDVTVKKLVGEVTFAVLLRELQSFYGGATTRHIVWDLTEGSLGLMSLSDIDKVANFVKTHAHSRAGGKTAIVAPADVEFGLGRMINTFGEIKEIPFATRTFRSLAAAADWIGVATLPVPGG